MPSGERRTLLSLFDGRRDAYFDSEKVAFGATTPGALVWANSDEEWVNRFIDHQHHRADIGVYPRRDDGTTKWGCIDIDSGDFSEALEAWSHLRDAGVDGWIEASGSWKDLNKRGYHVWVFAEAWVQATMMRALLVEVARSAGLPDNVEINPKQIASTKKAVGNCVRLPYGKRSTIHPGYSCMCFSPGGEFKDFSPSEFLDQVVPVEADLIQRLGEEALFRQNRRRAAAEAVAALRAHEAHVPPFGPSGAAGGGGHNQRAWKILNGLDHAADGERNICAFVISCHLKGMNLSLPDAENRMAVAVERSFDGGKEFLDEALTTLRRVYQS